MVEIGKLILSAAAGGLIAAVLAWRGFSLRPTKLALPFVDIELSRFSSLSPVQFFQSVSMAAIPAAEFDPAAQVAATSTPVLLIHAGWHMVCEAFVRRFQAYPDDEHINAAAAAIGGQNVEFLKMYRDIHLGAVRQPRAVDHRLAANYLARAPSLAERIEGNPPPHGNAATQTLLAEAAEIVRAT